MLDGVAEELKLLANQEAGDGGQVVRDARGRGMRAMDGAERVGHIQLGHRGKLLGQLGIVLLLARLKADVLEQHGLAGLDLCRELLRIGADDVLGQLDLEAELLAQALGDRSKGVLHVVLSLRTAEVRAEDDRRAVVQQVADGRQRRVDTGFIGDVAFGVERHVKVAAHGNLNIFDGHFVEVHGCSLLHLVYVSILAHFIWK